MRALRAFARRMGGDRRGMALVEFAMILVPLLIVLLGAFDLGYQAYTRAVLQGVLNDVSRTASVENPVFTEEGDTIEERIATAIEERVNVIARNGSYSIVATNFYEFSGVGRAEKLISDANDDGDVDIGDCWEDLNANSTWDANAGRSGIGGAEDIAFYNVTLTMPRILPMANLIGLAPNYTINGRAAIRNQPYANQAVPPTVCRAT